MHHVFQPMGGSAARPLSYAAAVASNTSATAVTSDAIGNMTMNITARWPFTSNANAAQCCNAAQFQRGLQAGCRGISGMPRGLRLTQHERISGCWKKGWAYSKNAEITPLSEFKKKLDLFS